MPESLAISRTRVKNILTRSSGYLLSVSSHSLQPYAGCAFGSSLCGVGCYMRSSNWINRGREWGSFVEVRENGADSYRQYYERERSWARRKRGSFGIFFSSATEPFQPTERSAHITQSLLEAMCAVPPDGLIVQTHSHHVADKQYLPIYASLNAKVTALRFHISIETDCDALPGLPRSASTVAKRLAAAATLRERGHRVVITVSPLLPIAEPRAFFEALGKTADAIVIDHFIEGDGSPLADGARTKRTALPIVMETIHPGSASLSYRNEMVALARQVLGPDRVGVGIRGFAGHFSEVIDPAIAAASSQTA